MGCCGSSGSKPAASNQPGKAVAAEPPASPELLSPGKSSLHHTQHKEKKSVSMSAPEEGGRQGASPPGSAGGWVKATRQLSQHEPPTCHTKPPLDWREWDKEFAKKYDIKFEIGRGTYGTVWRASHIESRETIGHVHAVAAKVVSRKDTDDFGWKRARTEMEVIKLLRHPNVVGYRDSFASDNYLITVMEMCRGGELLCSVNEHIQIYTENVVMRIITNILDGVAHMHENGVCHRDIKPANLLIKKKLRHQESHIFEKVRHEIEEKQHDDASKPCFKSIGNGGTRHSSVHSITDIRSPVFHNIGSSGHNFSISSLREDEIAEYCSEDVVSHLSSSVAICDFGMAVRFKPNEPFPSVKGLVGSPIYCPPEVLCLMLKEGKGMMGPLATSLTGLYEHVTDYDEKCDIWAIGIVTYILLAGYHPFMQNCDNTKLSDIVRSIIVDDLSYTEPVWENISEEAKLFVKLCLIRDYKKRPSALELQKHQWFSGIGQNGRLNMPVQHHHHPLQMRIPLALKTGETFGVEIDESMKVTYVKPDSAAARSGIEEGMTLLGLAGRGLRDCARMSIEEVDEALHCDGGASVKVQAGSTAMLLHNPMRRLLEAPDVDCNEPRESNHPGLAVLKQVIQEREEARWQGIDCIDWDEETLMCSKEVMMTIESALCPGDGRNLTAIQRLMEDLRVHHPEYAWFVMHDGADELDDYVNQLEGYEGVHARFSMGPRGFLVIGGHACRELPVEAPMLSGKEMKEFRINDTNLPATTIQQLYSQITGEGMDIVWLTHFMTAEHPEYAWVISLGTIFGDSSISLPSPFIKLTYQHQMTHCYGFRTQYLRPKAR
eukprot:TRINITY_DN25545_c0_g1_i1.p1 TRINITY_DN25545_c0_g1~~TRINITY_DN25545_c0_g1_i1.p1  ORF type:complete len:842 (+),score=240.52 TRINITY_DN25545_c0_g1_i1:35-2527(+)